MALQIILLLGMPEYADKAIAFYYPLFSLRTNPSIPIFAHRSLPPSYDKFIV
jgi:hypothetical protein